MSAERAANDELVTRLVSRLSHRNVISRAKAARRLGEIGDAAAIPHLQEALRRSYAQRSLLWHSLLGWLAVMAVATISLAVFLLLVIVCRGAPTTDVGDYKAFFTWLAGLRRRQDPFVRACVDALEQIAERNATPESRAIIPFLHGIAMDPLHHSEETRAAARLAAQRIASRTQDVKSLPVAAMSPWVDPNQLPIASFRN